MELSIIIPIYNAEKYILECLNSVTNCNIREMECILVNDGSTDLSASICQSFVDKDKRFKMFNINNSGVAAARNIGIKAAVGRYVMFLDADDFMDQSAWNEIEACIKMQEYNLVAYSYFTLPSSGVVKNEPFAMDEKECTNMMKIRNILLTTSRLNTCWGKLFLLDIIRNNHIEFRTDLRIGEDVVFVTDYFQNCSTAMIKNMPVLYYRQHSASAMRAYNMEARLNFTDILFKYNKEIVLAYDDDTLLQDWYNYYLRLITDLFLTFSKGCRVIQLKEEYKKALQRECMKEIVASAKLSKFSLYKRVECILLKKNWYLLQAGYFKFKSCFM